MPDIFPGMNPYLEHPDLWPIIHPRFVTALASLLQKEVSNRYNVIIRKRVYRVSGEDSLVVEQSANVPQVNGANGSTANGSSPVEQQPIPTYIAVPQTIQEEYIEIVDHQIGTTVTIVEVLTPQKKRPGRGRENYEQRCEAIFGSDTHFVEIDLLRGWEPISAYGPSDTDYQVLVSRSDQRPKAELYTWQVYAPIPPLTLPLSRPQDGEGTQACCTVDLKQALNDVCTNSIHALSINYERDPIPPLPGEASRWLSNLLEQSDLRQSSQSTNRYDEANLKKRSAHLQA
ncbi:DUF4058 family protein [Leptothoe spongobia]|uniref:DUF4058 family protein n=1 Tax=Leptothoe spongobia TAU-MAC 1115 TaxID=1967444 RepID=A0A947GI51_9CYAN|nr:DUF4058 family protein [Leptothoe spongobia]MBT9315444.1 DUF4058 family protein [Leptothoe spongobia TAU-MAC 1115]